MNRFVIVSAVPLNNDFASLLKEDDTIIACDAGYRNCEKYGVVPTLILGDFDSAPPPKNDVYIQLPREKDDTDTHYAAKLAVEKGAKEVLLLGAIGGMRLEHTLANFATGFWLCEQGVAVTLQDENSRISYLRAGECVTLYKENYHYLSLFPVDGTAKGVHISGAAYSVQDATLTSSFPIGVSNEFCESEQPITVSVAEGALMVIQTKRDVQ